MDEDDKKAVAWTALIYILVGLMTWAWAVN